MVERSGIRILLAEHAKIPGWVVSSGKVQGRIDDVQGKRLPLIEIPQSEAEFIGGGAVALRVGKQKNFRVGFEPELVLEIQRLDGELIKRNHHLCTECLANTGRMVSYQPGSIAGKVNAVYQCEQNPTHQWEIENV